MTTAPEVWIRRVTVTTALWVLAVSALAWWWMYVGGGNPHDHGRPPELAVPPHAGQSDAHLPGSSLPVSLTGAWFFLVMWTSMVVAMMLPVAIPLIVTHRFVTRPRGMAGTIATGVFVAGYLSVWAASGLIPLLLLTAKRWLLPLPADSPWTVMVAGLVIAGAGLFQFTWFKVRCLTVCRSPLTFVLTHDFGSRALGTFRAGALNGFYCLGCCWALMLTQILVGLHNFVWMGVLTILFLIERVLRAGDRIGRVVGGVAVGLGLVLMGEPLIHTPLAGVIP